VTKASGRVNEVRYGYEEGSRRETKNGNEVKVRERS
jgi:hypothetical protein